MTGWWPGSSSLSGRDGNKESIIFLYNFSCQAKPTNALRVQSVPSPVKNVQNI